MRSGRVEVFPHCVIMRALGGYYLCWRGGEDIHSQHTFVLPDALPADKFRQLSVLWRTNLVS